MTGRRGCGGGRHRWPEHSTLWAVHPVAEAGTVEAYGVPDFPRFLTANWVRSPECKSGEVFSLALNVHTPDAKGSAVTGLFAAPAPGGDLDCEMPDVMALAQLVDLGECVRQVAFHVAAGPIDLRAALASREGLIGALDQIEQGALARERAKRRRYRYRDRTMLQEVATVYLTADAARQPKTKAVAAHFGMAEKTAEGLIRETRRAGLLKPFSRD